MLSASLRKPDGAPALRNPLAGAHQRLGATISRNAVHVHLGGPDHPVDVDEAAVGATNRKLRLAHLAATPEALAVGLAERDVARGVLVEERVEKQKPALRDRRRIWHQRHLAEAAGALVGLHDLAQDLLALG